MPSTITPRRHKNDKHKARRQQGSITVARKQNRPDHNTALDCMDTLLAGQLSSGKPRPSRLSVRPSVFCSHSLQVRILIQYT